MAKSRSTSDPTPFLEKTLGYDGGVNIRDALNMLQPNEARIMENGILDERGGFNKRSGSQSQGTFGVGADLAISTYTFYRGSVNVPHVLMQTSAGKLYYTADPTANPIVWTLIVSGLSTTAPLSFETFNSKCYMSNGVDNYASWDGSTYSVFTPAPKGKFLRLWKDTMWVGGVVGLDDRLYASAPGDAETFPVANWVDIGKGDGDQCTAIGSDGFTLIFFKRRRHMAVTDPVTFANRMVDFEKGCESHYSVIQFEGYVYFLSRRGICRYISDAPSEIISYKLDPLFDPAVLNMNTLSSAWAYTIGNRVCWALPEVGSAVNTIDIEYYPRLGQLTALGYRSIGPWAFQRLPSHCFTRYRLGQTDILLGGSSTTNKYLYLFAPVGTDDGATFAAILETGTIDLGNPDATKYLRRMRVLGRGKMVLQIRRNYSTAIYKTFLVDLTGTQDLWSLVDLWGVGAWGPDSLIKEDRFGTDTYARAFSLRFTDAEITIGKKLLEVGSREYALDAGEWGIYMAMMEGEVLGVRD